MPSHDEDHRSSRQLGISQIDQPDPSAHVGIGETGCEATYLRSLVDSRMRVVVVMTSGETLRGRVRYYDRDCFSLGPEKGRPKVFLRKEFVKYIYEEEAHAKTHDASHSHAANIKAEDSKDQKSKESRTGN